MDAQAKVTIIWVAYAVGIVVTGSPFVAIIIAYFCRGTNDQPGVAGHNRAQIRSFWWAFLGWIIAIGIMGAGLALAVSNGSSMGEEIFAGSILMLLGILFGVVVQIAFTIYAIIGIVRASNKTNWPGADVIQNPAAVFG